MVFYDHTCLDGETQKGWKCQKHGPFDGGGPPVPYNQQGVSAPWPECPRCKDVRERDLCTECEIHKANVDFAADMMSWTHGFTSRICRCCYLAKVEETLRNVTANREKLVAELQKEPCEPA